MYKSEVLTQCLITSSQKLQDLHVKCSNYVAVNHHERIYRILPLGCNSIKTVLNDAQSKKNGRYRTISRYKNSKLMEERIFIELKYGIKGA